MNAATPDLGSTPLALETFHQVALAGADSLTQGRAELSTQVTIWL